MMDITTPMKALCLEDDTIIADYIIDLLQSSGWQVIPVSTLAAATKAVMTEDFDLLVLDRMLPDGDSLGFLKKLRQNDVQTPAIILTALGRTEDKIDGYESGADDYLPKPFEAAEFNARIKALLRRAAYVEQKDMIKMGSLELRIKARTVFHGENFIDLSPKEFELLHYFMSRENDIITRNMLLKDVWGLNFDPGTNVIDVNIGRLRKRIQQGGDSVHLITVRGIGFKLEEKGSD